MSSVLARLAYEPAPVERGYADHLLRVDLSDLTLAVERIPDEVKSFFQGGRGYCLWLVHEGTGPGTRFDSPENVLAVAGGPSAERAPSRGRGSSSSARCLP